MTPHSLRRRVRAMAHSRWFSLACGGEGNARITVPIGASMRIAADSLEAAGVIRSARAFRFYAKLTGRDRSIKAGHLPAGSRRFVERDHRRAGGGPRASC